MRSFNDAKSTSWEIDLNAGTLRRVQALRSINLTLAHEEDASGKILCERLARDTMLMVDVLWAICKPAAESMAITEDQFAERLGGGVLRSAKLVFFEEWQDFFRSLGQTEMAEVIQQTLDLQQTIATEAKQQFDRLREAMVAKARLVMQQEGDKALKELTRTESGESSSSTPESSESSLGATP